MNIIEEIKDLFTSIIDDADIIISVLSKINMFEKTYGKLFEDREILKEESEEVIKHLKILINEIIDDIVYK